MNFNEVPKHSDKEIDQMVEKHLSRLNAELKKLNEVSREMRPSACYVATVQKMLSTTAIRINNMRVGWFTKKKEGEL